MDYCAHDPATGALRERTPAMAPAAAQAELARVAALQKAHAALPLSARLDGVARIEDALGESTLALAQAVSADVGKPLAQARAEVEKCRRMCGLVRDMAPGALARRYVRLDGVDAWVRPVPLGTLLAVMPWNYPLWQALRCIVPQLAAGNGVLLKPAPSVLPSSRDLVAVIRRCWPAAPVGLVWTDNATTVGLIAAPAVRGAVCVGGEAAGRAVGVAAGQALKKCVLELGGNDAYVVLADAPLDLAVETCVTSRLKNAGQACLSAKRIIVEDAVYDDFVERLCARLDTVRMGPPTAPATTLGPLASAAGRDRLHAQVCATRAAGATLLRGGTLPAGPGFYYPPTVLTEVPADSPAFTEELFGPVFALRRAPDADAALALANQTRFGLGAALFSAEGPAALDRARRGLRAGTVALNGPATSDPRLPFGGLGESGHGVELGEEGLLEFTARQVLRAPRAAQAPLRLDRMDHHFELPTPVVDALRAGSAADIADYGSPSTAALATALQEALGATTRPVLSHGGEDALLKLLMLGRLEERRVLVLPTPSWPVVSRMASDLGYVVLPVPCRRTAAGHETDVAALTAAVQRSPRALVVVGSPSNPTGHATPTGALAGLIAAAPRARIVLDGVYEPLGGPLATLAEGTENTVLIGSFSSQLGLPGLRLGWMLGALPRAFGLSLGLNPSAIRAATVALAHRDRILADIGRARAAAAAIGADQGPGWTGLATAAPFVLTRVTVPAAAARAACAAAGVVAGEVMLDGALHLRFTLGPPSVEARVRRALALLG